jgi:hypothetical protein
MLRRPLPLLWLHQYQTRQPQQMCQRPQSLFLQDNRQLQ